MLNEDDNYNCNSNVPPNYNLDYNSNVPPNYNPLPVHFEHFN